MNVAFNTRPTNGPWGGGNRFVQALADALTARSHTVTFELAGNADIALIVDPRARNPQITFAPGQLLAHLGHHPETVAVHRINECDERKDTRTMNARLRLANYGADHTVFIGSWLQKLNVWRRETPSSVILNGADPNIFRRGTACTWSATEPLRIVTHHWGAHPNKGWDVYRKLDALCGADGWRDRIRFSYIGNVPAGLRLENTTVVPPLDGPLLAAALSDHHVYLTASINEPAGMHHIEGALIGLPLVYRRSGALPEYCAGFGEAFEGPGDLTNALKRMFSSYPRWKSSIAEYPHTSNRMTAAYIELFERLYDDRESIAARRRRWRSPVAALMARVPF